jgi:hypothetical protein
MAVRLGTITGTLGYRFSFKHSNSTKVSTQVTLMRYVILLLVSVILFGCNFPMPTQQVIVPTVKPTQKVEVSPVNPTTVPTVPDSTSSGEYFLKVTPTQKPPLTPTPSQAPTSNSTTSGEESILILEPGPGSRLISPLHVSGVADPTFEQTLGIQVVLDDGKPLAIGPVYIEAEAGQRGPFTVDIPFEIEGERQAFIQIFSTSPRDGGITHLNSVGVILANSGDRSISTVVAYPERITIFQPTQNSQVNGGTVHVEGFALASFEQTLLVEIHNVDGEVVGLQPVTVNAPDLGQPGPFSIDVNYSVDQTGPGRVVVRDVSPAFDGDVHRASVEVELSP